MSDRAFIRMKTVISQNAIFIAFYCINSFIEHVNDRQYDFVTVFTQFDDIEKYIIIALYPKALSTLAELYD